LRINSCIIFDAMLSTQLTFITLPFADLTVRQLYDIMALRQEVFVVEQNCPYLDADGKDPGSWHLVGIDVEGTHVAYARLLPPGLSYEGFASIGRVVSSPARRGQSLGKQLVAEALSACRRLFGDTPIQIGAQYYLLAFYRSFGFEEIGDTYLEDGIPHIHMVKYWK